MSEDNLYRVIKPYDSNLLHSSKSLIGGASKCYKELKKVSPNATNFSIIHMKNNEIYDFNINNMKSMNQTGGGPGVNASLSDLEILRNQMTSIEKRIIAIENKLNMNQMPNDNISPNQMNQMNQMNQNNDMNLSKQPTQPQSLEPQQKPIEKLMQENNRMNTLGQNIQASQMPSMPGMGPGSSRFAGGFENPSAKATGFYSAARDFV